MRLLLVHPGSGFSTHDVFMGVSDALQAAGHEVAVFPLDVKLASAARFLDQDRLMEMARWKVERRPVSEVDVQLQACESLIVRHRLQKIDVIYIVSGMFVPVAVVQVLHLFGIKVVLHLTESPYDTDFEAKLAPYCAAIFTNERTVVDRLAALCPGPVRYLRHAWRAGFHDRPQAKLTAVERRTIVGHAPDVLFVGTGFPSRVQWLSRFRTLLGRKRLGTLDLYGAWVRGVPKAMQRSVRGGVTDNLVAAALYQRAFCGLNLYRTETGWTGEPVYGESLNPRAYELAASGTPFLSAPRLEHGEKFGDLAPQVETPEQAIDVLRQLRGESGRRRRARKADLRAAVAGDTWDHRIDEVLPVLESL